MTRTHEPKVRAGLLALTTARLHHRLAQDKEVNPSATAPPSPAPVDNGLAEYLMEGLEYDPLDGSEVVHLGTFALPDPQPDAVIDLDSRQVVGWSLQLQMQTSLVKDALTMAWFRRQPEPGLIFHCDRGSQYCSQEFQDTLKAWQMRSSMSRKGNCWDNAPTESFWGRLKTASVHGRKFATRRQAAQAVMDWIAFYNHSRLHSSLGYVSPMQFEQRWFTAQRKGAA